MQVVRGKAMSTQSSLARNGLSRRTLAYCHDSVGLGHFHRTLAICERVSKTDPSCSFLLATGTPYAPIFELPQGVDYVKLPALAKTGSQSYRAKFLNTSVERVLRCREALLLSTAQSFEPAVFLVDKAPSGVCGELRPTLRWLRENRPQTRIIFGMRDIEDDPQTTIAQWNTNGAIEALDECYDEIWVYGMRSVFDVAEAYELPDFIRDKMCFVGYVVQDPCRHELGPTAPTGNVLVTVGGGTDGEFVLKTFLAEAAQRIGAGGDRSTIVGGPDLPRPVARALRGLSEQIPSAEWLDYVSCMNCQIRKADVVVSMGGYNSLCEVVSNRKPAVVIPRTSPRLEQTMRARLWSRRAELKIISPEELTPPALADQVINMLGRRADNPAPDLDFGGLDRVSERFCEFWNGETDRAASVRMH